MNVLALLGRLLLRLGPLILKGLKVAHRSGLTDIVAQHALKYVRLAADQFADNEDAREWAVQQLIENLHVSESVARIAVEIAVQVYKDERRAA